MRPVLWAVWLAFVLSGLACAAIFMQGVLRDTRAGEPEVGVSLARDHGWLGDDFRVWRPGSYRLHLSSVNHDPPFGTEFGGAVEVQIVGPEGQGFRRSYRAEELRHVRPQNMHWTALDSLALPGNPLQRWRLEARVTEPDTAFGHVTSTVSLRRIRQDPGMGGLINYVMPIPAVLFLAASVLPAAGLRRRGGSRLPLQLSAALLLLVAVLLASRLIG